MIAATSAINALTGVPIQQMLADRGYRTGIAACVEEGHAVHLRTGIQATLSIPAPLPLLRAALGGTDFLYRVASRALPPIDPFARSSMWDDLERGRRTEIQALHGEVVALARAHGLRAPVNSTILSLIEAAEGKRSPCMSSADLLRATGLR
jgi:2-dehydropantoate 2-reductase